MKNLYEGEDSFEEEDLAAPLNGRPRALDGHVRFPRSAIYIFPTSAVLFLSSLILFSVSIMHKPSEQRCTAETSAYCKRWIASKWTILIEQHLCWTPLDTQSITSTTHSSTPRSIEDLQQTR